MQAQLQNILNSCSSASSSVITNKMSKKTVLLKRKNKLLSNTTLNTVRSQQVSECKSPPPSKTNIKISNQLTTQTTQNSQTTIQPQLIDLENYDIPSSDPIWLEIIPQDLLLENQIEKLIEENKEYFYNLLGLYLQERMLNEMNMSRLILPQKYQTQYTKDFTQKSQDIETNIDSRIYEDYKQLQSPKLPTSTYKQNFQIPKLLQQSQSCKPIQERLQIPFAGTSTYRVSHLDFKTPFHPEIFKAPTSPKLNLLPLKGISHYHQDFKWPTKIDRLPNFKDSYSKLNPICSSNTFFVEKQRPSKDQEQLSPVPRSSEITQIPSFRGQFNTIFRNDYQHIEQLTPKMKNWRANVYNKLKQRYSLPN